MNSFRTLQNQISGSITIESCIPIQIKRREGLGFGARDTTVAALVQLQNQNNAAAAAGPVAELMIDSDAVVVVTSKAVNVIH